jgi:hypothetical protein
MEQQKSDYELERERRINANRQKIKASRHLMRSVTAPVSS